MNKFDQIEIVSKEFNSVYQIVNDIDCEKIRVSEGIIANKHDTQYIVRYKVEPEIIVLLHVKTPKDCVSSGVSQYNESSSWKMGFSVGEKEAWVQQYVAVWEKIEELLTQKLTGKPLNNGKYVNAKLITWDGEIRTCFRGISPEPEEFGSCYAIGVLKIASVYRRGSNY